MQTICFIGNLTKDPAEGMTPGGTKAASLTVAVNRNPKNGEEQTADYFRCSVFGKVAENCMTYLKKGSKVYVAGELRPKLLHSEGMDPAMILDVKVSRIEFLSKKSSPGEEFIDIEDPDNPFADLSAEDIPFPDKSLDTALKEKSA